MCNKTDNDSAARVADATTKKDLPRPEKGGTAESNLSPGRPQNIVAICEKAGDLAPTDRTDKAVPAQKNAPGEEPETMFEGITEVEETTIIAPTTSIAPFEFRPALLGETEAGEFECGVLLEPTEAEGQVIETMRLWTRAQKDPTLRASLLAWEEIRYHAATFARAEAGDAYAQNELETEYQIGFTAQERADIAAVLRLVRGLARTDGDRGLREKVGGEQWQRRELFAKYYRDMLLPPAAPVIEDGGEGGPSPSGEPLSVQDAADTHAPA